MAERRSALNVAPHRVGEGAPGVRLSEAPLTLWQVAVWPDAFEAVAAKLAKSFGDPPPPGRVAEAGGLRLLRAEPLAWWILGGAPPVEIGPEEGATLDLSHGRTLIRIEGPAAAALLARFVSVDLRDHAFPDGACAATGALHSQWTVIRRDAEGPGYDLLVGRSFARDVWEQLEIHARQFGLEAR